MSHLIKYEDWIFPADKIREGNIHLAASLLSSSLEVNSLSVMVRCDDPAILNFKRNSKLIYYMRSGQETVWRVQSIERTGPKLYRINGTSTLGLLIEGKHYGGIYNGNTVQEVVSSICGTTPVIVKNSIKNIKLYGWLPIASPRDNLAQVLFAAGAALKTDLDGTLRIDPFWGGVSRWIGKNRMYVESTITYDAPVTDVSVTEHQYRESSSAEQKQLFEGSTQKGDIITFDEPMHSVVPQGLTILDQGANWVMVAAGSGALFGKPYAHTTRDIVRHVQDADTQIVKSINNATLVSLINSQAVAARMVNYYKWREKVSIPAVYHGESAGDVVEGYHPFDQADTSYCIESADISMSNTLKAEITGTIGFVPMDIEENLYLDNVEIIEEDQEWTVPEGIDNIRVTLIGGGQAGWSGREGTKGNGNHVGDTGGGAPGGKGGQGGNGGNIFEVSIDVVPGQKFSVTIGKGGPPGGYLAGFDIPPFEPGTNFWKDSGTLFGEYSSDSGQSDPNGFLDPVTKTVYAKQGDTGRNGAYGGLAGDRTGINPPATVAGADGGAIVNWETGEILYAGGVGGKSPINSSTWMYAGGGGGGGAAFGENGKNGGNGALISSSTSLGGVGGAGGNAIQPEAPAVRGQGGCGGNGGGGGGSGGIGFSTSSAQANEGGSGGNGSKGGQGADGIVLIYYAKKKSLGMKQLSDKFENTMQDRYGRYIVV